MIKPYVVLAATTSSEPILTLLHCGVCCQLRSCLHAVDCNSKGCILLSVNAQDVHLDGDVLCCAGLVVSLALLVCASLPPAAAAETGRHAVGELMLDTREVLETYYIPRTTARHSLVVADAMCVCTGCLYS